jgi:hypothetical protein
MAHTFPKSASIKTSLTDLPDETISLVLKFCYVICDRQHPARWLARFGSLCSKYRRIIVSTAASQIWSQIPVCLCDEVHCDRCGREKVPMAYYKNVLHNCCLERLDVHFSSVGSIFSPGSDGFLVGKELIDVSSHSLTELTMHTTIIPQSYEVASMNSRNQASFTGQGYGQNDSDTLNNLNHDNSFTTLRTMFVTTQFLNQDITWSQYRASDIVFQSAIKFFGKSLHELSLHSLAMLSLDVSDEIAANQHLYFNQISLQELCPYLETLELNGHLPSVLLKDGRYLTMSSLQTLRVNNPYFWEWNGTIDPDVPVVPFHLPNLVTFIADATYEHADQIVIEVLPICPPSVTHLRLMGNTMQYLNEILCHVSIMLPRNLRKIISLEIYDCYFPSLNEEDILENYSIHDIGVACPELERLILPIVRISTLAMNSLMLTFGSFTTGEFLTFQRSHK